MQSISPDVHINNHIGWVRFGAIMGQQLQMWIEMKVKTCGINYNLTEIG